MILECYHNSEPRKNYWKNNVHLKEYTWDPGRSTNTPN